MSFLIWRADTVCEALLEIRRTQLGGRACCSDVLDLKGYSFKRVSVFIHLHLLNSFSAWRLTCILGSARAALHESDYQNNLSLSYSAPLYLKPSGTPGLHIREGKKPACVQRRNQSLFLKGVNPVNPGNSSDIMPVMSGRTLLHSYLSCLMIPYPKVVQDVNLSCYKCSKKVLCSFREPNVDQIQSAGRAH